MIQNIYPERDLDFLRIQDPGSGSATLFVARQVFKAGAVPA
jgi:hypothetical protein